MPIAPSGQPARPKVFNKDTLPERTLKAWKSVPRAAFVASWVVTGYFQSEHFEDGAGLTPEEASKVLDATGMLRAMGVADDMAGEPPKPNRPVFL